jgi:argininosuccinate synthase
MKQAVPNPKKIVLAYSGGLDTSVILPWLKDRYPGVKLVAFAAELGQGDELHGIEDKARKSGADEVVVMDLRRSSRRILLPDAARARDLRAGLPAGHEHRAPLIAAQQVEVARQTGADAVGHGATGKGNDQVRFELTYMALAPELKIIAPWKDPTFELRDRESAIEYAKSTTSRSPRARRRSTARIATSGTSRTRAPEIEHPEKEPNWQKCLTMVVPPEESAQRKRARLNRLRARHPDRAQRQKVSRRQTVAGLNEIGGRHGVGISLLVENRLVGMKSRGVYETPGGTILYEAHKALEQICIERDTLHYKSQIALRYAELVYNGQWFHPLREALQTFIDHTMRASQECEGEIVQGSGARGSARRVRTVCTIRNSPASAWRDST